ncbi:MAG: hypothetical protein QM767_02525 [Anaeromyxobacter sp.]
MAYPLSIVDERPLPAAYRGPVWVSDVDKTYLSTRFSSLQGLARIPLEFAIDKLAIPGMPEVLRAIRHGPREAYAAVPLYFLSASPAQLRAVLERKMLLDGVEWDGLVLKDWARALLSGRPGRLREQLGFKLAALLTLRRGRPLATEWLIGDDTEQDALAYALYARILSGELRAGPLDEALREAGVAPDDRACVDALARGLPPQGGQVERAFIHLERRTDPASFAALGERVVPVRDATQLALALFALGQLRAEGVIQAGAAAAAGRRPLDRAALLEDALARGLVTPGTLARLPPDFHPSTARARGPQPGAAP